MAASRSRFQCAISNNIAHVSPYRPRGRGTQPFCFLYANAHTTASIPNISSLAAPANVRHCDFDVFRFETDYVEGSGQPLGVSTDGVSQAR
jgi:hypothetical protein